MTIPYSNSIKKHIGSFFLCVVATGARADCMICDEIITLNSARADCFLKNYDELSTKVSTMQNGRMIVDLDDCSVEGEALSQRAGLNTLPRVDGDTSDLKNAKSVYLLDSRGLSCLHKLIATHSGPLDPLVVFDLFEGCRE